MKAKLPITGKKIRPTGRGLTTADRKFIASYLEHGEATRAYHDAGFNGNNPGPNGYKMLHKAGIQEFLGGVKTRAVQRVAKRLEITVEKVLEDLEETRVLALNATPSPQCAAAINASVWQGKHIGMWDEDRRNQEQMPTFIIKTLGGAEVAIIGRTEKAIAPPRMIPDTIPEANELPDEVDEVITDADLIRI